MKYIVLMLGVVFCLQSEAQTQKKPAKKSSKKKHMMVSRSGIKVDTSAVYAESPDTIKNEGVKNINPNYNETTPGLSPNSGSDGPILK